MDDDGLVLNLASNDVSAKRFVSVKKSGKWTDRLKAKRVAEKKRKLPQKQSHVHGDDELDESPRPVKRARLADPPKSPATAPKPPAAAAAKPKPSKNFISSLFTSNPVMKPTEALATPTPASGPSNAPVTDSSTFLGLGLDPLLVTHLQSKLNIEKPTSIQRASLPLLLSADRTRDVFIQSQTGSGKTLSFLLPIIQDLLPLSRESYIDRSIGTLAIIIAPTRELAKQISDVLESLLTLRLHNPDNPEEDVRLTRWMISGLLTGGATRTHEKARLRKGLPILVSTPGRLLDHLQNTSCFNVGKCRWLVLDEADRLMDLGFEETITGILKGIDGRRNLAQKAAEEGNTMDVGGWDWSRRRRTVLCSATIREDVQKLAGQALLEPAIVKGSTAEDGAAEGAEEKFAAPAQLQQKCVVVPLKLRLVTLVALVRSLVSKAVARQGQSVKIIVFLSCTDSVDFHWDLLRKTSMDDDDTANDPSDDDENEEEDGDGEGDDKRERKPKRDAIEGRSALLPNTSLFRLHGSLATHTRLASLKGFSHSSTNPASVLLCTSVAARGLDLPHVRAVIQYDLPTEGGATEHVHRVGRTARLGARGEAWAFVAPSEETWVDWVQEKTNATLARVGVDAVLRGGFGGGNAKEYEARATQVQTAFEHWVLKSSEHAELARKAFTSHVRAYATHPGDEKHMFHVRHLHLGHLAKAFALREAPSTMKGPQTSAHIKFKSNSKSKGSGKHRGDGMDVDTSRTEQRMEHAVRQQGKLTKKGGMAVSSGANEFQQASTADLERMAAAFSRR
ncbi:DEAD-domain-containing protein [Exidia glandulosa HHB12029]|uniref:ATP-dependent RNA helicase n=1 Tax=Exidia glandulosa HHB12029 TaxID=1314781 RepID=A0A165L1U6_EXIGL|nr:DEAD-domain-containing protein [Exidia glandulosa HHB12029]